MTTHLPNPLSLEQRTSFTRVIDHDVDSVMGDMRATVDRLVHPDQIPSPPSQHRLDQVMQYVDFTINTFQAIQSIVGSHGEKEIPLEASNNGLTKFLSTYFGDKIPKKFTITGSLKPRFLTQETLLELIFLTLVKNANNHAAPSKIELAIGEPQPFPTNALYIPQGAENYSNFISFQVKDNGRGFPADYPFMQKITTDPKTTSGRGFGLYLTGLASQVLRAPIDIQSRPGDTIVSFYHPVFEEEKR